MERHRDYYGDYQEPQWNPQLATSSWPSVDHFPHYDNYVGGGFPENGNHHYHYHHQDGRHENQYRRQHHYNNFGSGPNDSISGGGGDEAGPGQSLPFSGRKRPFPHSAHDATPDCKGVGSVKLYVGGIPRTVTEEDVRNVFEEHGNVVEVVFIKDKRTGQQQECCFVKYGTLEEADRAIGALNFQYTFYGSMLPIKVRYADKERERIGINASGVGNPQASSGVFGAHVHKLYVGCLNKQAAMKDIEEIFSPYGLVKDVYIVRDELKQSRGCAFVLFSQRDMAVAAISELNGKYFTGVCDHPLVVKFAEPRKPRDGEARPSACHTETIARAPLPNSLHVASPKQSAIRGNDRELADTLDCDWSEHICPDGYTYYYNCVTLESRWEKPEEYMFYEQQSQRQQQETHQVYHRQQVQTQLQHQQLHQTSLPALVLDCAHVPSATSAVVAPACV